MATYWDIRDQITTDADAPEYQACYDNTNFKCYLLEGITYNQLFNSTIVDIVKKFITKIKAVHEDFMSATQSSTCILLFNRIIAELEENNETANLLYRDLYEIEGNKKVPESVLINFSLAQMTSPNLIFTFLLLRELENNFLLEPEFIDSILEHIGDMTELDTFTIPRDESNIEIQNALYYGHSSKLIMYFRRHKIWYETDCISNYNTTCHLISNSEGVAQCALTGGFKYE